MLNIEKIAGIDGCKNGWAVVEIDLSTGEASARVVKYAHELLAHPELGVIVVDIPIGFPERAESGGRACEREARKELGGSSVFPSPARAALSAQDDRQACQINQEHHACCKGISKQCFCLFPKMREIDALMPNSMRRIVECHPELCFWAMNGEKTVATKKKTVAGLENRKDLLMQNGFDKSFLQQSPPRMGNIVSKPDDFLDACAAAWTALRIVQGSAKVVPEGGGEKDAKGVKMEMWY